MTHPLSIDSLFSTILKSNWLVNDQQEMLQEEVTYWIARGNELPPQSRVTYEDQIHALAQTFISQLSQLKIPSKTVKKGSQAIIIEFRENGRKLLETYCLRTQKKTDFQRNLSNLNDAVSKCGKEICFQEFSPKPLESSLDVYKKSRIEGNMAVARLIAGAIDGVGYLIEKGCQEPPEIGAFPHLPNPVCLFAKTVATLNHEVAQLPGIRQVVEALNKPHIALQQELESQYAIPRQQTEQYGKDALTKVVPLMIPSGAIAGIPLRSTGVFRPTFLSFLKNDSGAVRIPAFMQVSTVQKSVDQMFKILKRVNESTAISAIDQKIAKIEKNIPRFNTPGMPSLDDFWNSVLGTDQFLVKKEFKKNFARSISMISSGGQSYILKQAFSSPKMVIHEAVGLQFINSLRIPLRISEPLLLGCGPQGYFLIKPFIEGETITKLYQNVRQASNPAKRELFYNELKETCYELGQMDASYQNSGLRRTSMSPNQLAIQAVSDLESSLTHMDVGFLSMDRLFPLDTKFQNYPRIAHFIENPGEITYGFYDIHADQFVRSKELVPSIGFFDGEAIPMTFTPKKEPAALSVQEFNSFKRMISKEGMAHELSAAEISSLETTFREGFFSTFKGKWSFDAEKFFELQTHTDALQHIRKELSDHVAHKMAVPNELMDTFKSGIEQLKYKLEN